MLDAYHVVNLVLAVTLVSTLIGIFFFTYAAKIEREIVVAQVNYITQDLFSDINQLAPEQAKVALRSAISRMQAPAMEAADQAVAQRNQELMTNAGKILGAALLCGLGSSFLIAKKYNLDFKELLISNLIILAGIGVVEFSFATWIATNYISGDPNYVRRVILESLRTLR